ncbi:UNVERIFIED_CONTAM: hypothetical protein Sradi_3302400 [Sesamum radiatum]|uniref:Uncharacterized protein n=1 Tax=Sesamum radiatum TaxID=300843 RepID=A0AAW2R1B3_SESRA
MEQAPHASRTQAGALDLEGARSTQLEDQLCLELRWACPEAGPQAGLGWASYRF